MPIPVFYFLPNGFSLYTYIFELYFWWKVYLPSGMDNIYSSPIYDFLEFSFFSLPLLPKQKRLLSPVLWTFRTSTVLTFYFILSLDCARSLVISWLPVGVSLEGGVEGVSAKREELMVMVLDCVRRCPRGILNVCYNFD